MIKSKITSGFVIQNFNTETKEFVSQEFFAGECDFENENGGPTTAFEEYLPFDMVQPNKNKQNIHSPIANR